MTCKTINNFPVSHIHENFYYKTGKTLHDNFLSIILTDEYNSHLESSFI